jgi:hypothetical protein
MSVGASNAAWLAPGCRLDRYDLLLQVAEGGMGLLWLARQQGKHGFDKLVAIKTILPRLASDAGFRQMFLDEARVVSRIEHPNVAQVLDLGEERGVLFLVMEWIDGESLIKVGHWVAHRTGAQIPVGVLTRVMIDACAGLHAAHQLTDDEGLPMGVVHRDVSPHNLLIGFRGTTKVIDFGIAKVRNRVAQDTSTGLLKGKIAYMAPEQAMGNGVDRRTDVWSAGASMYRFLAGRVPYNAPEPLAVLRLLTEGLPPAPLPETVPEPIRLVVERAIDLDAAKRFDTAQDMGLALETAMRVARVYTTREDVAEFMAEHLGEDRAMRTRAFEQALRESRAQMRAEPAHDGSASGAAHSLALGASGSDGASRPSRQPTAIILPSRPSLDAREGPEAPPQRALHLPGPNAGARGKRWVTGASLLGLLLVAGFAGRSGRTSRAIDAVDVVASPARLAALPETSMLSPSDTPGPDTAAPTLGPSASARAFVEPRAGRASAAPLAEPSDPDRGAADLLERARIARRTGRIGEAAALFAAAVEKAPTDSEALTGLAEVDDAQGATAKAIIDYRHALAVNPKYLPARLGLADSLWTSGRRDEARTAYRGIVDDVPTNLCPDVARERAGRPSGRERPSP